MVVRGRNAERDDSQWLQAGSHQTGRRGHHQGLSIQGFRCKGNVERACHRGWPCVWVVWPTGKSAMKRLNVKRSMMTAAVAGTLLWYAAGSFRLAAQEPSTAAASPAKAPRMGECHPALSGVGWRGADIGGRSATPAGGPGGAQQGGGRPAQPPPSFSSFY